jgi:Protein of unknown function (DUF3667)
MSAPASGGAALTPVSAQAGPGPSVPPSTVETRPAPAECCANCGATLSGPYCSQCGQRHEHAIHSFWHFLQEGFEDLTHADSRLWRTLGALVLRPGSLTREFLEGRRARYLPPVRLYLVLSLAFFLIAGLPASRLGHRTEVLEVGATGKLVSRQVDMTPARARQICGQIREQMPWLGALGGHPQAACAAAIENNGRNIDAALLHEVPRAMFLFLPLLGLIMKGLYRRPPRHYVEHLLFFVHDHAYIFLLLALYALLAAAGLPAAAMSLLGTALWLYVLLYFFLSMRRVYGQGRLLTAGKLVALSGAYFVFGGLMLAAITVYAMFTA